MSRLLRLSLVALAALLVVPSAAAQCNIDAGGVLTQSAIRGNPGDAIDIIYTFGNDGRTACPPLDVGYYLSTDAYLSADDTLLGTGSIPASNPQQNVGGSGTVTIPAGTPRGGYRFLIVADYLDAVPEDGQGNNVVLGKLTVGGDLNGPNLTIVDTELDETTAAPGGRVSFDYGVQNQGRSGVGDVTTGFYLRPINAPPSEWIPLGSEVVGNVEAGETENENEEVTIPQTVPPARYALLVVADDGNAIEEFNETDNVLGAGLITITGTTADEGGPGAAALALAVRPNPSAGEPVLSYTLAAEVDVRLAVVDALGREVAVVASGRQGAGAHTAAVGALPPGVYAARLVTGAGAASVRFTVVR